jgi:hypothetical protein
MELTMQYKKGAQEYPFNTQEASKITLGDEDGFTEKPWAYVSPDGKEVVLLNDALMSMPFKSWGAVLPNSNRINPIGFYSYLRDITLHPDAWDEYIKLGIIDEKGNLIQPIIIEEE